MEFNYIHFYDGQTPLHLAIVANSIESVNALLSSPKVKINIKDNVSTFIF